MSLSPLLINETTREPYLRLPSPHSNIIITPPRASDAEAIVEILNDRRVFQRLEGPPYPYRMEHARAWLKETSEAAEDILKQLKDDSEVSLGGCPVRILREVDENGDVFLGDCRIGKWTFEDIADPAERETMIRNNESRPPGDPETLWTIGDYLAPSHHGKGIMTLALGTLLEKWFKPKMGVTKIKANVLEGNQGSVRVFEKNGFVLAKTLENNRVIPESKGGGLIGLHIMAWQLRETA